MTIKGSYVPFASQVEGESILVEAHVVGQEGPVVVAEPAQQYDQEQGHQDFLRRTHQQHERTVTQQHGHSTVQILETLTTEISGKTEAYIKVQSIVEKPRSMSVDRSNFPECIVIARKWYSATEEVIGLLFFTCMWNGFMIAWNSAAIISGIWIILIIPSLPSAICLYLNYEVARQCLNSTLVTLSRNDEMEVKHAPLSFCQQPKYFQVEQMQEVDCKRCVKVNTKKGRTNISYAVNLIRKNTHRPDEVQRTVFLSGLRSLEEALFFAQEVKQFLGTSDSITVNDGASSMASC